MVYRLTNLIKIMYKVTTNIKVNKTFEVDFSFNEKSNEYYKHLQQQIIEGIVKEMYKNNCIEIEKIESNAFDFEHITYTATGYVLKREEIDKAIELLTNIKFGGVVNINENLNQLYDILTKTTNGNMH